LRVEHRDRFEPVRAGLALAQALAGSHPRRWDPAGLLPLVGDREVVEQLLGGAPLDDVVAGWEAELRAFRSRRARHLLYPGGE
jgi:predicted Zn-dependent peptidase